MTDSCENCRFWKRDGQHEIGSCRRRAPLPCFEHGGVGVFAKMASFDWCGEHKPESATIEQLKLSPAAYELCRAMRNDPDLRKWLEELNDSVLLKPSKA